MLPEPTPPEQNKNSFREVIDINPNRRTKKLLEIPLMIEHIYLEEETPDIIKVYQLKDYPYVYIVIDSQRDFYVTGLELSPDEETFVENNREEFDNNDFLLFRPEEGPDRWIHKIPVIENGEEKEIIISYSKTETIPS